MYKKIYKGQEITTTWALCEDTGKKYWYFQINGGTAEERLTTKRQCLEWAKLIIDHPTRETTFPSVKFNKK